MVLAKLALLLPLLATPQSLDRYIDHNRVLLIFASLASPDLQKQQLADLSQHEAELKERDLVLIPVPNGREASALRAKYNVPTATFTVILIGKDGGEKLRRQTPISYKQLAETIDAMPMRQDEMRHKQ